MTELRRGRQTTIEATPEPITIDTARTAVIVVDMQNDFGTKGGVSDSESCYTHLESSRISPPRGLKSGLSENGLSPGPFGSRPDSPNRAHWKVFRIGEAMGAPDGTQDRVLIRDT